MQIEQGSPCGIRRCAATKSLGLSRTYLYPDALKQLMKTIIEFLQSKYSK
jgi:hypothetical protein